MTDLNEKSLEEALAQIGSWPPQKLVGLVVTESGIDYQAARLASGELTEDDLRKANLPEDLIAETKRRAGIL
jgi:hypothetical protein